MFYLDLDLYTFNVDETQAKYYQLNGRYETVYFIEIANGEYNSFYSFRFVIFFTYQGLNQQVKNRYINIDKPFVEYYLDYKGKTFYEMSPPSEE